MSKEQESQAAAAMLKEGEDRVVWLLCFLVLRAGNAGGAESIARCADESLAAYRKRFDAIPPGGPSA